MIAPLSDEDRARISGKRVVASISGGKDSAAMSLWLTENGVEHTRVFANTHWEHRFTYRYLRETLVPKLGTIIEIEHPEKVACPLCEDGRLSCVLCESTGWLRGMPALILKKGMFPSRQQKWCTSELKTEQLARFVKDQAVQHDCEIVNSVGIRAEESEARAKYEAWEFQEKYDADVWRPLIRFTEEDVIELHRRNSLAPNPLYLMGCQRVGCWPCIFSRKDEVRLIAESDPERVERLHLLEEIVSKRARDKGDERYRSFFALWQLGEGTRQCAPISEVVAWSKTASGGRNLALFAPGPPDEGCGRWGLCGSYDGGWPTTTEETKREDCSGVEGQEGEARGVVPGQGEGGGEDDLRRDPVLDQQVPGPVPRQGSLFLEAGE